MKTRILFVIAFLVMLAPMSKADSDKTITFNVNPETGHLYNPTQHVDVDQADGSAANYSVHISNLEFSEEYCSCTMSITANGSHPWDKFVIYRLKTNPPINLSNLSSDAYCDVEEHAEQDPYEPWCYYEVSNTHIDFKDTFEKSWVESYDLCYCVHDTRNNSLLYIVIKGAFGHDIVTGIDDIVDGSSKSVLYYNVNGNSSKIPFEGMNIVVTTFGDGNVKVTKMVK